jgi:hypothetical protein
MWDQMEVTELSLQTTRRDEWLSLHFSCPCCRSVPEYGNTFRELMNHFH